MFMQISNRGAWAYAGVAALFMLSACGSDKPDNSKLAEAEQKAAKSAEEDGRVLCALDGATVFDRSCTMDRLSGQNGEEVVLSRGDGGFRRLRMIPEGGGLAAADGAEPAKQAIVDDGLLEITIGNDRYRLPAKTKAKVATVAQSEPMSAAVQTLPAK